MLSFLSARRYELLALGISLAFVLVHQPSSVPMQGLAGHELEGAWPVLKRAIQTVEGKLTDAKFRFRGEREPHPNVVVIEADEKSVAKFGLWPWSRVRFADALRHLVDAKVASIGLDITFVDQANDGSQALRELVSRLEAVAPDAGLAVQSLAMEVKDRLGPPPDEALRDAFVHGGQRIVQGVITYSAEEAKSDFSAETQELHRKHIAASLVRDGPGNNPRSRFVIGPTTLLHPQHSAQTPLPIFAEAGTRFGHFNMTPDVDGTVRRMAVLTMLTREGGALPSMALQAAAAALDAGIEPLIEDDIVFAVRLKREGGESVELPMELEGHSPHLLINYPGPRRVFNRLSIVDVIEGTFDPKQVEGKVALMGVTITGSSGDQRVTPFKEMEPGVYTHASVVSNILANDFLRRPYSLLVLEMGLMLALGLLVALLIPRVRSFWLKGLLIIGTLGGWVAFSLLSFNLGYQVALTVPLFSLGSSSFAVVFLGYLTMDREKLKLRSTFTRYLGEDVMEAALANPERLNIGEKREMSVLFSDIRGFTTLSEKMTPEALASFINGYLSPMTQLVFEEKGTLDKYIGDAVMAFWNAPLDQTDHALRACRCAVRMLERLDVLKKEWLAQGFPELEIGIGVNTGPMIVGNMGSDVRVDYTVLGDAVNLGARLEGTNKEYGTRIIVSEYTFAQLKGAMTCRRLGAVRVKGKRQPVGIYELRADGAPVGVEAEAIATFERGLEAWVNRRFDEAGACFREVLQLWPDDVPSRQYLEELDELIASPPGPEWDGVVSLKTK